MGDVPTAAIATSVEYGIIFSGNKSTLMRLIGRDTRCEQHKISIHTTFSLTLTVRSVMLRPCTGLDHAHSDCSQAATSYHHCAESRPASCSHWRSHKRCTVVSAFAIEAPTRHEKMIYARKARLPHDFCTCGTCLHQKRCASLSGAVPSAENHMCSCPAECHKPPFAPRLHDSSSCATSSGAATVKSLVLATSGTVVINHAKGSSSGAYSELPCAAARRRAPSSERPSEPSSEKVGRANFCECNVCNGK
jgi:hypothetical protein